MFGMFRPVSWTRRCHFVLNQKIKSTVDAVSKEKTNRTAKVNTLQNKVEKKLAGVYLLCHGQHGGAASDANIF